MSISFFCIATEPIKNMYPIKESINSILPLADEIIIVFGREEEETYKYFKNLDEKIKIYNTNKWPIDWSYDVMTYHFDYALKKCTADICIKIDIDFIFKAYTHEQITNFKNLIKNQINLNHIIYIPRYNYYPNNKFILFKKGTYAVNKYLLNKENKKYFIGRKNYSNISIIENEYSEIVLEDIDLSVINYDCTFMNKEKLITKQYYWFNAYLKMFGSLSRFNIDKKILNNKEEIIKFVTDRVKERIKWAQKKTLKGGDYFFKYDFNFNPKIIREKLIKLDKDLYGYNYFGRKDIIELLE